jgi:uncharacterized caspase-like protein
MRRGLIALLGLLLGSVIACGPAMAERRVALVVGNAHYANTAALRNSVTDAQDVAAELKQLGFEVTLATDLDESAFGRQIDDFGRRLKGADVGLFYYAGHGVQVNNQNYLVAINAKLESEFLVPSETIEVDAIIRLMESRTPINLVFLDACRDNPLAENLRRTLVNEHRSVSLGRGLARVEPTGRDTLVAFSAAPGQEAEDGTGRNSPFAAALLHHMPEPGLEVSVMLKLVSADVRKATNSAQRPQQLSDMTEAFYFAGTPAAAKPLAAAPPLATAPAPSVPAASAPDRAVEVAFFQTAIAANDCAAIRAYLARYPDGIFVDLAGLSEQRLCSAPARVAASEDTAKTAAPPQLAEPAGSAAAPPAQPMKRMVPPPVVAALPPTGTPAPGSTAAETARMLQSELLRVGCGGPKFTANGDWDDESRAALAQFNRVARTSFTGPSEAAITAVHGRDGQVCPILCGPGQRAQGNICVAEPEPRARAKKHASRPRSRGGDSDERASSRPPRQRDTVRSRPESASGDSGAPHLNAFQGSTSPISGPNGMKCHTLDQVGSAPRIVCN